MVLGQWLGRWSGNWFGTVGEADPNAMAGSASFSITTTATLTYDGQPESIIADYIVRARRLLRR
jgi:hypothetical protein